MNKNTKSEDKVLISAFNADGGVTMLSADEYTEPNYPDYDSHYAQNPFYSKDWGDTTHTPSGHYLSPWTGRYW